MEHKSTKLNENVPHLAFQVFAVRYKEWRTLFCFCLDEGEQFWEDNASCGIFKRQLQAFPFNEWLWGHFKILESLHHPLSILNKLPPTVVAVQTAHLKGNKNGAVFHTRWQSVLCNSLRAGNTKGSLSMSCVTVWKVSLTLASTYCSKPKFCRESRFYQSLSKSKGR